MTTPLLWQIERRRVFAHVNMSKCKLNISFFSVFFGMDKVWYGWPQCFLQHAHECRGESKSDVNFILYNVHLRNRTLNLHIGMALFQKHLKPYKSQSSTGTMTTTLIYHIFEAKRFPPWYLRTLGPQVLNIFKKSYFEDFWKGIPMHPPKRKPSDHHKSIFFCLRLV